MLPVLLVALDGKQDLLALTVMLWELLAVCIQQPVVTSIISLVALMVLTGDSMITMQMQQTLKREEFVILSGAITALCDKIEVRLNDKLVENYISMLSNI